MSFWGNYGVSASSRIQIAMDNNIGFWWSGQGQGPDLFSSHGQTGRLTFSSLFWANLSSFFPSLSLPRLSSPSCSTGKRTAK